MPTNRIVWDATGEHIFETGVKNGVLYLKDAQGVYSTGVAWNGLTSVSESPEGAEATALYADDIKYLNLMSAETFKATVEAYTYPDEFAECDGSASIATGVVIGQQARKPFGLCYRTAIGNDVDGNEHGYKLHIVYGCQASPSEKQYSTINDSPDPITLSWELSTTPVNVTGKKPTATLIVDSTKAAAGKMTALENLLYGVNAAAYDSTKTYNVGDYCTHTDATVEKVYKCKTASTTGTWSAANWDEVTNPGPRLPLPDEIATLMTA